MFNIGNVKTYTSGRSSALTDKTNMFLKRFDVEMKVLEVHKA